MQYKLQKCPILRDADLRYLALFQSLVNQVVADISFVDLSSIELSGRDYIQNLESSPIEMNKWIKKMELLL